MRARKRVRMFGRGIGTGVNSRLMRPAARTLRHRPSAPRDSCAAVIVSEDIRIMMPSTSKRICAVAMPSVLVIAGLAAHTLGAQQSKPCTIVCAPTVAFNISGNKSHVFGSPTVRNDTTGAVSKLPSKTNLQLQIFMSAKTQMDRLSLFAAATWLPSATTRANPFTEYTASQVGEDIKANHVNLSFGVLGDLVPAKMTHGWLALQAYLGDLLSPAARPNDASAYTHKLDLGGVALLYPFGGMDTASIAHKSGLYLYGNLDYVATGLPKKGDDVPRGVRTFLTNAKPAVLIFGVGMPIAPLLQAK
jgi:hypothetical protein